MRQPTTKNYGNDSHTRFAADLTAAGFCVYDYHGRNFYSGPAVDCDSVQDVIRATSVEVQWDGMGKGFVVYPR